MQRQDSSLCTAIVCQVRDRIITGHARNAHDVALALVQHGWQEFLDQREVAQQVDTENLLQVFLRGIKDCVAGRDPSVVDEDRRAADLRADGGCCQGHCRWGSNVASVE